MTLKREHELASLMNNKNKITTFKVLRNSEWVGALLPTPSVVGRLYTSHLPRGAQSLLYRETSPYNTGHIQADLLGLCSAREVVYKVEKEPFEANCGQNADQSDIKSSKLEPFNSVHIYTEILRTYWQ